MWNRKMMIVVLGLASASLAQAQNAPTTMPYALCDGQSRSAGDAHTVSPAIIQTALRATLAIEARPSLIEDGLSGESRRLGTGVMIGSDGLLVTNALVLGERDSFVVRFFDGSTQLAHVVGVDRLVDIALAKVESRPSQTATVAPPFPTLSLKLDRRSQIGEPVVALGYPMNFGLSATRGIVSGLGRAYDSVWPVEFLQHDAALNPGNSGGPLIDAQGCLIGLNTATPIETQFDIGVGLAIPADLIAEIMPQLFELGYFPRGYLGVYVSRLTSAMASALGIAPAFGVIVDDVERESNAARGGLLAGDIITHFDERPISQPRDLTQHLLRRRTGEALQVQFLRRGQPQSVRVVLGQANGVLNRKPQTTRTSTATSQAQPLGLGFEITALSVPATIHSVDPGGIGDSAGLSQGDVVQAINGVGATDATQAQIMLQAASTQRPDEPIVVRIGRNDMRARHVVLHSLAGLDDNHQAKNALPESQSLPFGPF